VLFAGQASLPLINLPNGQCAPVNLSILQFNVFTLFIPLSYVVSAEVDLYPFVVSETFRIFLELDLIGLAVTVPNENVRA
jgi:hypothetical protein